MFLLTSSGFAYPWISKQGRPRDDVWCLAKPSWAGGIPLGNSMSCANTLALSKVSTNDRKNPVRIIPRLQLGPITLGSLTLLGASSLPCDYDRADSISR